MRCWASTDDIVTRFITCQNRLDEALVTAAGSSFGWSASSGSEDLATRILRRHSQRNMGQRQTASSRMVLRSKCHKLRLSPRANKFVRYECRPPRQHDVPDG